MYLSLLNITKTELEFLLEHLSTSQLKTILLWVNIIEDEYPSLTIVERRALTVQAIMNLMGTDFVEQTLSNIFDLDKVPTFLNDTNKLKYLEKEAKIRKKLSALVKEVGTIAKINKIRLSQKYFLIWLILFILLLLYLLYLLLKLFKVYRIKKQRRFLEKCKEDTRRKLLEECKEDTRKLNQYLDFLKLKLSTKKNG